MKGKAATSSHINPYALEEPERVESSVARSRRARNAAQRVDDEVGEFYSALACFTHQLMKLFESRIRI